MKSQVLRRSWITPLTPQRLNKWRKLTFRYGVAQLQRPHQGDMIGPFGLLRSVDYPKHMHRHTQTANWTKER